MRRGDVKFVEWRQSLLLLVGASAFFVVGVLWTLLPLIAIGGLLFVMAVMVAFLKPLVRRG